MVGPGRPQFVLFGSSIVQQSFAAGGWGAILADLYDRKADIFLRGYSGWNSRRALEVLDRVFPKEAEVQPSLVIVYFGGNDAMHPHPSGLGAHVPLPEYIENMKKICLHLKSLSDKTRLIFLTSPPINEAMIREHFGNAHDNQDRKNETCRRYAEALVDLCKQLNVKVINVWTALQQREDWATTCLTDGIHFTREGSQLVVKEILKVIKEADWDPSLFWTSMPTEFADDSPYYMYTHVGMDHSRNPAVYSSSVDVVQEENKHSTVEREREIERERGMVGRPQLVLFGSSIVQMSLKVGGWGSILTDLYDTKADVIIRGYSGWNSRSAVEVLNRLFPQDAADHPSLVIVYFGGNDAMRPHPSGLGSHVPLPEYVENMKNIALHLRSLSENIRMIFLTSPPVDEAMIRQNFGNAFDQQERTNEACGIYSEALVELCKQMDIKVINLWAAFQHRHDWAAAYLRDGIHLSSGGSKVVVKEILKVLREAEWEPSLYWLSMPPEFPGNSPCYPVGPDGKTTINISRNIAQWKIEWMERDEVEALASVSVPW